MIPNSTEIQQERKSKCTLVLLENLPFTATEGAILDAGPGYPFWVASFHSKWETLLLTLCVTYTAAVHEEIQNAFTCLYV